MYGCAYVRVSGDVTCAMVFRVSVCPLLCIRACGRCDRVAELELQLEQSKKSHTKLEQRLATATKLAGGTDGTVGSPLQQVEDMRLQMEVGERKLREMTKL